MSRTTLDNDSAQGRVALPEWPMQGRTLSVRRAARPALRQAGPEDALAAESTDNKVKGTYG